MNYLQENLINKLNISNEDDVSFLIGADVPLNLDVWAQEN